MTMTSAPHHHFSTVLEALDFHAGERPDEVAYSVEGETTTFGELRRDVDHLATALLARGAGPGSRCAIILPTGLDTIRLVYAVQRIRALPVLLNSALPQELIRRRIDRIGCGLAISNQPPPEGDDRFILTADLRAAERDLPPSPAPDDVAFLQFTSGTTGEPRAAVILHRNLVAYMESEPELYRSAVFVTWIPLHHDLGLVTGVFASMYFGTISHLIQPSLRHLGQWLMTISRVGGNFTAAPDFAFRIAARMVPSDGIDLRSLRYAANGGEPVKLSTIRSFEEKFGIPGIVRPGYGLAEATLAISNARPGQPLAISPDGQVASGSPRRGVRVRILRGDGSEAAPGEKGEIIASADQVFAGYLDAPEATAAILRDGWLHTGDLGMLDEQGQLFVFGRLRAMIKKGGSTIAPRELEEIAEQVDGVRAAAAFGISPEGGDGTERIVLLIETTRQSAPEHADLQAQILDRLQKETGILTDEVILGKPGLIARTANGKTRYEKMQELYRSGRLGAGGSD
ncbi:MAG TPA: AMP-binding protein [Thermoanaerobaculia bacterium]|nr:AMP-binding protein [Thermoanaerobaculia bacterium]